MEQEDLARRAARSAKRLLGGTVDVSPMQALLDAVRESAANVEAYREMVATLSARGTEHPDGLDSAPMWGPNHLGDAVPHIAVTLYNAERERLVKISAAALQAGATEAMVRVHQGIGALVAGVLASVIDDPRLGLDPDRRRLAKATAAERLIALEASTEDVAA